MPPKFTSRQLQYDAPPVPNFLRQLHGQVNARNGHINDKRPKGVEDEFGDLLSGASPRGIDRKRPQNEEEEDQEWDGAQIVILKKGKHLSKEDLEAGREDGSKKRDNVEQEIIEPGVPSVKIEAGGSKTTKGDSKDSLKFAKDLIADSRIRLNQDLDTEEKLKRKMEKEKQKEEKNKRARLEKSKRGKGLSFSMDD